MNRKMPTVDNLCMRAAFCFLVILLCTMSTAVESSGDQDTCTEPDQETVSCDFEVDSCGWKNSQGNNHNWRKTTGFFGLGNKYMSLPMSNKPANTTARLESPWLCPTVGKKFSLRFRYYLYYNNACRLSVFLQNSTNTNEVWSEQRADQTTNFKELPSPLYLTTPVSSFKIFFEGRKLTDGPCGNAYNEIDIDDIVFREADGSQTTVTTHPSTSFTTETTEPETESGTPIVTTSVTADTGSSIFPEKGLSTSTASTSSMTESSSHTPDVSESTTWTNIASSSATQGDSVKIDDDGLSGGVIAGIVIAVLLVVIFVVVLVVIRRRRQAAATQKSERETVASSAVSSYMNFPTEPYLPDGASFSHQIQPTSTRPQGVPDYSTNTSDDYETPHDYQNTIPGPVSPSYYNLPPVSVPAVRTSATAAENYEMLESRRDNTEYYTGLAVGTTNDKSVNRPQHYESLSGSQSTHDYTELAAQKREPRSENYEQLMARQQGGGLYAVLNNGHQTHGSTVEETPDYLHPV